MASFTAKDVQGLRQATGAGMMDAKKALVEADGDFDAAAKALREKGLAKAAKREDRENNDGAIAVASNDTSAALVQLRCETDFSAKSTDFVALVGELAELVLAGGVDAVAAKADAIDDLKISKKENIELGAVEYVEAGAGSVDRHLSARPGRARGQRRRRARRGRRPRHTPSGRTPHRLRQANRVASRRDRPRARRRGTV